MQIEPQAATHGTQPIASVAPPASTHGPSPGTVVLNTPSGGELELLPGRQVVARVIEVGDDNSARISLAGQTLTVQTDARLRVGDSVQLAVERADSAQVRLSVVPVASTGTSGDPGLLPRAGGAAAAVIGELARAGVPVTPELAKAVATIAQQMVDGGNATGSSAATARSLATLAGRDIALSPAAASRVAAALDLAGSLGPSLAALATRSSAVAAALPSGPPNADSLRALLTPGLEPAELAIARIVQASAPAAVASGSANQHAAIRSYVAAQVTATLDLPQVTAATDHARLTAPITGDSTATVDLAAETASSASRGGLAAAAAQAAVRGQSSAAVTVAPTANEVAAGRAPGTPQSAPHVVLEPDAPGAPPSALAQVRAAPASARENATASAATGAATATAAPTSARVAQAVADLGALAARVAIEAPAVGAASSAAADAGRSTNATAIAQNQGRDGAVGASRASVAGSAASGDAAPVVTAIQEFLASPRTDSDATKLLRAVQSAPPQTLYAAIRTLSESQSLQLAGALLDQLPASSSLGATQLASLRAGVHGALHDLGAALRPTIDGTDAAVLRQVLHQVATSDIRPAVAHDAAHVLAAIDGQQIMSRTASGVDPGYMYFQVPLPDGRGAEVMVRRDPARRDVSFDEFNIAFLLNTERLGTLMIQLDAHPSGIKADIKTDAAGLGDLLQVHAEALAEPLAAAARRPVTVTTGLFDDEAPNSLLDQAPRAIPPGGTAIYA